MQHEFNDRIAAQRAILGVVNNKPWPKEPLLGLSSKAIDRWIAVNKIEENSQLAKLIREVSGKLFFLANKSQEQISNDYKSVRTEIMAACDAIKIATNDTAFGLNHF